MSNVFILVNDLNDWKPYYEADSILTVSQYLEHKYDIDASPKLVINLARNYGYNSEGYYSSLLAQARGHKVIPNVQTINKLSTGTGVRMPISLQKLYNQWVEKNQITTDIWYLNIYFGRCAEPGLEKIARFIFDNYPCPLLKVAFNTRSRNQIEAVTPLYINELTEPQQDIFANALDGFNKKVWRVHHQSQPPVCYLGILYEPGEKFPPSDKQAMNRFMEIAKKMNIHAELITEEDAPRLLEFDALFIRTTTSLNHYTYYMSQKAASNDLVVIDDPVSIIRCTNKVYLSELFQKENIPAPKSKLLFRVDRPSYASVTEQIGSPFVLKIPDGSFSIGMRKITCEQELEEALDAMFKESAILLAQAFTPTEFDWRIGILDGEPLFACKYYMAKNHWQIYHHSSNGKSVCGAWDTLPLYKVPKSVIDLALKASSLIGKGLYGVDLKVIGDKPMVIEINDNPSIDHEVEDAVLGDELYYRILNYFVQKVNG